jgi:HK97 gp10 family phage protein
MNNGVQIEVKGFEKLKDQLKQLANDKDKKSEILLILRQVARPTLDAARSLVPVSKKPHMVSGKRTKKIIQPGALKKSLGTITGRRAKNPTIYVGPRAKGTFDGWYGHFVHDGHDVYQNATSYNVYKYKKRSRTRNTLERVRGRKIGLNNKQGRVEGQPFLTQAYNQTNGSVTADAEKRMVAFIQRRISKLS